RLPPRPTLPSFPTRRSSDLSRVELPVAIVPTYVHRRMSAQRSCFTIHGRKEMPLSQLVTGSVLKRYSIDPAAKQRLQRDLNMLGDRKSTRLNSSHQIISYAV